MRWVVTGVKSAEDKLGGRWEFINWRDAVTQFNKLYAKGWKDLDLFEFKKEGMAV